MTLPTGPSFTVGLAFLLGMAGQVAARHLRVPGIVVLLALGVAAGPDGAAILHPESLGVALPALVSFAVSIILFEGALALDLREAWRQGQAIRRLVTVGAVVTAVGASYAAHRILGWQGVPSLLFGTLMIVTGPTVIQPILRRIRVNAKLATILEGEAILGDAIGATLAVLALELALAPSAEALGPSLGELGLRLGVGLVAGLVAGGLIAFGLRFEKIVPIEIRNALALAIVVGSYQVADAVAAESGIVAAIVAGLLVGNLPAGRRARGLHEFKQEITTLLLGLLFVLLAADVRLEQIRQLGLAGLTVVVVLVFVVRPLAVALSTVGSDLRGRERLFLAWLAPRGIVAAAVASYFADVLRANQIEAASELRALVFLVIAVTVSVQGLSGALVARLLRVARPPRSGWALLGANGLALALAERLAPRDEIIVVDSSSARCRRARDAGFHAVQANGLEEETLLRPAIESRLRFVAVTPNEEVNFLFARRVRELRRHAELWLALRRRHDGVHSGMLEEMGAHTLFGGERQLELWALRLDRGLVQIEAWRAGDETVALELDAPEGDAAGVLPLVVRRQANVLPYTSDYAPRSGDEVDFALFSEQLHAARQALAAAGWERAAGADDQSA